MILYRVDLNFTSALTIHKLSSPPEVTGRAYIRHSRGVPIGVPAKVTPAESKLDLVPYRIPGVYHHSYNYTVKLLKHSSGN